MSSPLTCPASDHHASTAMSGHGKIHVLNVAEKPSVVKSVAEILSCRGSGIRSREGQLRYMLMSFVTSHLMEIYFDECFRKWHSCNPADLYHTPICKYIPQDKLDLKKTLKEEARRCQWLVLWLDCDREGENIAFEVVEVCTFVNSHINIWRARFSALSNREIHASVQNLVQPKKLFADGPCQFQKMLLKDTVVIDFAEDNRSNVLSYGPCQFFTLGFIAERYWEIQSHELEEFLDD